MCDGVGLGEIVAANILSHANRAPNRSRPAPAGAIDGVAVGATPPTPSLAVAACERIWRADALGDYAIDVAGERVPPAPWANIIANPAIGFCVTERGGGFAWAENSYFFRLTPWYNDPVSDPCGEVLYLRDVDSGACGRRRPGRPPPSGPRRSRRDTR